MSAIHGAAEKCSCIFGMSAIHGAAEKCSCIFGMSATMAQPKNAPAFSACRPSMAAKKSARPKPGESQGETVWGLLQASPVDQAHVTGTQIEVASEQGFDLLRLVTLIRRLINFHDSAEFLIRAGNRLTHQNEVRVVLNAHGAEV
jgi:hypothetical protein